MGKVILDISMSLDGFITASNRRPEEPMGDGGQQLHAWAQADDDTRNRQLLEDALADEGVTIAGRTTYDTSVAWWGADGPTGPARRPVFVVTHSVPSEMPAGGVYTFVTEGIERALQEAKAAAGDKHISVMGGANIAQQFIKAGFVDELAIHLVPVLFGSGTRLFEHLGGEHIHLATSEVIETQATIHLRFRVIKGGLHHDLSLT